jgi:hypothetical protein
MDTIWKPAVKMIYFKEPLSWWQAHPKMGINDLTSPISALFSLVGLDFISTYKS